MSFEYLYKAWFHDAYYLHGSVVFVLALFYLIDLVRKYREDRTVYITRTQFLFTVPCIALVGIFWMMGKGAEDPATQQYIYALAVLLSIKTVSLLMWFHRTREFDFPLILMLLSFPIPLLGKMVIHLQSATAVVVTTLGVPVRQETLVLTLPEWSAAQGDKVSGFSSYMIVIILFMVLTKIFKWHLKKKLMLFAVLIPMVFIANVIAVFMSLKFGALKDPFVLQGNWKYLIHVVFYVIAFSSLLPIAYKINPRSFRERLARK